MKKTSSHPARNDERGSAFVLAMVIVSLLTSMGVAVMLMAGNEAQQGKSSLRAKTSFFLAEAGQEDARATLFTINGNGDFSDDLQNYAGLDGVFNIDPAALQVIYDGNNNATGLIGYGDDVPLRALSGFGSGWYAAFLSNDPADGVTTTVDTNDLVMITAVGIGEDKAVQIVQAIVERWDVVESTPPATITLLGPTPVFDGGNANPHRYIGNDCDGSGVPGMYVPIVGVIGPVAESTAEMGINSGPDYMSGTYSDVATFADLTDASEPTVAAAGLGTADPLWTDCQKLHDMIENMRPVADHLCVGDSCALPNPLAVDDLTFIDGDFVMPPVTGQGTIVVTGSFTWDGRASWNGMIFAVGEGVWGQNGGGDGVISGSVMIADIAGPDNVYGTGDDCTGGDNGFDSAQYDISGGGRADAVYCTADLVAAQPDAPYRITSFRQF